MFDQNIVPPMTQKNFGINFFGSTIFLDSNFLGQNSFLKKNFLIQIFFGSKFFGHVPKIFFILYFFGNYFFLNPNYFYTQNSFGLEIFFGPHFLYPKLFITRKSNQRILDTNFSLTFFFFKQFFLDQKLFWMHFFLINYIYVNLGRLSEQL